MKRTLNKREVGLLLNSDVSQSMQSLIVGMEFAKVFGKSRYEKLSSSDQEYFNLEIEHLITSAKNEWEKLRENNLEDESTFFVCELCGNTRAKERNWIQNQKNGKVLKIGNECITHFGIGEIKSLSQLKKVRARERKEFELREYLPGLVDKIEFWDDYFREFPVIIPESTRRPYKNIGEKLKETYQEYLENKIKDISNFERNTKSLFSSGESQKEKISKYYDEVKEEFNVVTQKIFSWIKSNQIDNVITEFETTGIIKANQVYIVEEREFLLKCLEKLKNSYSRDNMEFLQVDRSIAGKEGYVFQISNKGEMKFLIEHRSLFAGLSSDQSLFCPQELRKILKKSYPLRETIQSVLDILDRKMSVTSVYRRAPLYDSKGQLSEVGLYNAEIGKYARVNIFEFVKLTSFYAIFDDVMEDELVREINKLDIKWRDRKELDSTADIEKLMRRNLKS